MAVTATGEGWGWPLRAGKPHYFVDDRSLCGRWLYFGPLESGRARVQQDCAECARALKRELRPEASIPVRITPTAVTCGTHTEVSH